MEATKPAEMLRTALSTIVLVFSAVGSVINLVAGNHLPTIMLGVVVLVIVVLILAEVREKREKARREIQEQAKGAAAVRAALMVAPTHLPPPPTMPATEAASATWRWDAAGQLVLRMTSRKQSATLEEQVHA